MNAITQTNLENLHSTDKNLQNEAFFSILATTDSVVDWAYMVWDSLVVDLTHKDNHRRAIAAQILCNLAKSDPENRMSKHFDALLSVTKDERFVTARHCLQALWKVGVIPTMRQPYIDGLTTRFQECITEKNTTLIRYDIIQSFRNVYDAVTDENVKTKALALIEIEDDLKYRKKYASVWRIK